MATATLVIGPEHHGQKMSLEDFENAEGREGHLYELGRGVIVVSEVPNVSHLMQLDATRRQLSELELSHPDRIVCIASGSDCKILLQDLQSERHPDAAVYLSPPPEGVEGSEVWALWIPEIVVEVVSPSSADRDYNEKPEEYLQFGVKEYWIIDSEKRQMTALIRSRGAWRKQVLGAGRKYSTPLLPGFELDLQAVFEAASSR